MTIGNNQPHADHPNAMNSPTPSPPSTTWLLGGAILLLVVFIGYMALPTITICGTKAIYANLGNHLRCLILQVNDLHNLDQPWPASEEEYLDLCRAALMEDGIAAPKYLKGRRPIVIWDQFARSDEGHTVLPVAIFPVDEKSVLGFTDGHYETLTRKTLEKYHPDFLHRLPADTIR